MSVAEATQDPSGIDAAVVVHRHTERLWRAQALQHVHVVGQRGQTGILRGQPVVPACPRSAGLRQDPVVRVQNHLVVLIRNGTQDLPLRRRGIGQHLQRLVAVCRDHDRIEARRCAVGQRQRHRIGLPGNRRNWRRNTDAVGESARQCLHVGMRSPLDHPPGRAIAQAQEPVPLEEADEIVGREIQHALHRGRPDCRAQRENVLIHERLGVGVTLEVLAQRDRWTLVLQELDGLPVEAHDVPQHPVEGGPDQVPALGEQRVERGPVVLETRRIALHAETHVRRLRFDAELGHKPCEVRIGRLAEHDEPGVDGVVLPFQLHVDGVRVPPHVVVRLEHGHFVIALQQVGCDHTRDAAAHHSHLRRLGFGLAHWTRPSLIPPYTCAGTGCRSLMMPNQDISFRP